MSDFAGRDFIDQATQSLQGGRFEQALEFAENALALAPDNSEAYVLMGIAQSQLNRPHEAEESFRKAIELAPASAKAHYNLAVHYYGLGRKPEAFAEAAKAVECDPSHTGARDLAQRLDAELNPGRTFAPQAAPGEVPPVSPSAFNAPPAGSQWRAGYESPIHSLRFVENMGAAWDGLGWLLTAVAGVFGIIFWVTCGSEFMRGMQELASNGSGPMGDFRSGNSLAMVSLYVVAVAELFLVVWTVIELIDRRGPWLWLLPMLFCCCCGLQGVVNGIYLLAGRAKK